MIMIVQVLHGRYAHDVSSSTLPLPLATIDDDDNKKDDDHVIMML